MGTRSVEVLGKKYTIKAWTVGDREAFLDKVDEIKNASPREQWKATVSYVAEQTGLSVEELQSMDVVEFDMLFTKIIEANRGPLPQLGT